MAIDTSRAQEDVAETKANQQIDTTPIKEPPITDADRSHWSFAPIHRHPLPPTKQSPWLRSPADSFILARLEAETIEPAAEADRPTLLRRLTFDLTGLPPTPAQLTAFDSDRSPDAFERQIDRLLASPAFGDRYAQHWLDLARFAETDGFEHDYVRPHAWKYRDWVIAAFNADIPYDDFIRHQLAGDEIGAEPHSSLRTPHSAMDSEPPPPSKKPTAPPPTLAQIPTTFCLAGSDMPDVNDQLERRHALMNEMAATVGAVFMGLQLGCAQCHNHKYDPISQADFYRLRAVFEPAVATLKRDMPFNYLTNQPDPAPARFWIRGDHRRPGLQLQPAFPRIASPLPSENSALRTQHSAVSTTQSTRSELAQWLVSSSNPLTARVIANRLWQHHFGRGLCVTPSDFGVMGGPITHPDLLDCLATELRDRNWSLKQLHRTILTSATYRQQSNAEFGLRNAESINEPTASTPHSALLTPQFASPSPEPRAPSPSPDPDNSLYSHFPRQRLSGEAIRDSLLSAAGLLSTARGGPGVMPPLPEELLGTLLKGQWTTSKREADHYKRSIYVFARRNLRYPLFEAFDRPDANATCPIRNRSTTAPQSLLLFNSELSLLAARHLAGRVMAEEDPKNQRTKNQTSEQIDRLYAITLSRRPTTSESTTLEKFLTDQQRRLATDSRPRDSLALPEPCPTTANPHAAAALVDACLALLNTNEFIYVD